MFHHCEDWAIQGRARSSEPLDDVQKPKARLMHTRFMHNRFMHNRFMHDRFMHTRFMHTRFMHVRFMHTRFIHARFMHTALIIRVVRFADQNIGFPIYTYETTCIIYFHVLIW